MQPITQRELETLEPAAPSTLVELLRERAQQRSFKPLYTFLSDGETEEVSLTYGELEERARAIGRQLQFIGAESERVLLLFPQGLDYIAAFFGCLYAGAIAVPAYPPRLNKKQDRLLAIIADAQASVILTTTAVRQKAQPLFAEFEQLKGVRWLAVDEIDLDLAFDWEAPKIGADSIAFLQYTSGSTSIPKGVMVTHGNLLHNEAMIKEAFRQSEQSIIAGWLPLYHDMGLIGNVLQPLYLGVRCILMSPVAFLQQPFRWLSAISRYRATTSGGPNFAYELCVRKISREQRDSLDLSSWEVAFNGAEPIRAATQESFAQTFAACGFRPEAFQPCYGLAEATLLVTGKHRSELAAVKRFDQRALEQNVLREITPEEARVLVSNGATLGGQQVRIVNPETLIECAPDEVGEVWVSGSSVTRGYWNWPEETRQTFGAHLADTGEGPFLRTGDMGFLRDAELFITGRLKDLVIIRGLNHYPQDIEVTAEESCAALRPGCGVAFSIEVEGEEQLVIVYEIERHAELDIADAVAAIREAVAEQHEVQVYAVSLIATGTIPKTSSGKLQRRACRDKFLHGSLEVVAEWRDEKLETPETESSTSVLQTVDDIAAWLMTHLAARMGVAISEIDVNQSFARYGVDSLAAIEMAHEVETRLGISVSIARFLESTSILQFASEIEQQLTDNTSALSINGEVAIKDHALSYGQRSLWFLHNMEPSSAAYNIASAVRIRSELDVRALRAALQSLIDRHASLRTTFTSQHGEPIQRVHDFMELCFTEEDAAGWDEEVLNERLVEAANRPFDLEHGPLLRVSLFKKSDTNCILLLAVHHIVTDFWSLAILVQELGVLYRAETDQSALPVVGQPYTDYARWQASMLEGPEGERLWSYWKQRLSGELPALNLPIDHPRPAAQTYNGASVPFKLNAELTEALQELSRANDATLYMTLLAAFQVLLSRYTGQTNFAVGSPTAGRRAGWTWTIGYFVNPVVMRAELSGDPTFADYLKRVRQQTLATLTHLDFPFQLLVERLQPERDLSRSPLFQTMFVLQKSTSDARFAELASGESGVKLDVGGLSLESIAIPKRVAQFDLTLMMAEAEGEMSASFIYNTDLFEAATISRLAGHFRTLLEGIIRNPEKHVARLPLLTGNERRQLLVEWNKTAPVEWGVNAPAISADLLHQGFEAQAARTPHEIALIAGEERLTYAELDARSNQLAHHLLSLGVTTESRVGLLTERNTEMVIAILAVLKAGAAYVALDPQYPHERIAFMLADSGAKVLLTQAHLSERLTEHEAHTVLLDAERSLISRQPMHSPSVAVEKVNLAYVIYTSGSTGRPKGVAIEHQSAVAMLDWAHHTFRPADLKGVLFSTSICFDLSIFELFVPLWCGGAVILADNALHLPLLAARSHVTLINTVPSAMAELVRSGAIPASVRVVNLAGEPLTTRLTNDVYAAARVEQVWNLYGPTEDTTYSTFLLVEHGQQRMTIGRPIKGTQAYVLDQSLQPAPIGVSGQLYLGGEGLARGYLARPELTAERFIPDPFSRVSGSRLYGTGDLVRYLPNREIEYLGRMDHQVKVRGFRIELGEIETALLAQSSVKEAVVVVSPEANGTGQRLVAYVVGTGLEVSALRRELEQRLPHYMAPSAIVVLSEMPLTPNGKIDRKALPAPEQGGDGSVHVAARSQLEEIVSSIWQEVLGSKEHFSVEANFFSLGGHSLLATQVLSRIDEAFQVKLPLRSIFESPTIAGLAAQVADHLKAGSHHVASPIKRVSREADLPLSFAQQRLWFLQQWEPVAAAYNIPAAVRLKGLLDESALARSLEEVLRRHESLRTTFQDVNGKPVQVISPPSAWNLPVVKLSSLSPEEREAEAMRLAREEVQCPFDLSHGPLLRASLLRLGEDEHILLVTMHHIVSDGWSIGVFIRELTALYNAFSTGQQPALPSLPVQYADFAYWQREQLTGEFLDEQLAYWKRQLGGSLPALDLPTVNPRPARQTYTGATETFLLAPALSEALKTLSSKHGVTLFMSLLAAFQTLLHRYTGQEDILVGTPVAGRTKLETENLIGFFVNTLVLRTDLSGAPTFAELLKRVREVALEADLHQDVPFELLVEDLQPERSLSTTPLFQVMFAMQNAPLPELSLHGLKVTPITLNSETAKFDLTLSMRETSEGFTGTFEYNTDIFDQASVTRMARHFERLLEGVVAEPGQQVTNVALLTEAERRQLLVEWNKTDATAVPTRLLHQAFEAQVERTPQSIALIVGEEQLTYAQLNNRANQLAHHLLAAGVTRESIVGLLTERNTQMVVAMLAVLKAGAVYLPLDPQYPHERIAFMLADAGAKILLTQQHLSPAHNAQLVYLDTDQQLIAQHPRALPEGVQPDVANLAYVIYTSGSTGRPKGVAIEHQSAVAMLDWAHCTFRAEDLAGVLASTSICFDLSIFELFVPLSCGGTVILADNALHLPLLPARSHVTLINTVPSAMTELVRSASIPDSVRVVNLAGEPLTTKLAAEVYRAAHVEQVWNLYGPTEDTTYSTAVLVHADKSRMTIGRPITGTQAYVLDQTLQPVPVGVSGELYLGGAGLARGYLARPELTAEKFIPDPFSAASGARMYRTGDLARYQPNGEIEYLGRMDHQVKVRGFRIELGEIETVLRQQEQVQEAVVVARENRLVAYVVAKKTARNLLPELWAWLRERLPHYMVPSAIVVLPAMPLTPNGKTDRKRLPDPEQVEQGQLIEPRTQMEEMVRSIWQELLKQRELSVEANFFSIGGHSLLATQVLSRVKQMFQVDISLSALFERPTIAALAAMLEESQARPQLDRVSTITNRSRKDNVFRLSYAQQRLWFLNHLEPDSPFYNMATAVRLKGSLDTMALEAALGEVVRRHEALRTVFTLRDEEPVQVVSSDIKLEMPVHDLGHLTGAAAETEVKRFFEKESQTPFDLSQGPLLRVTLLRLSDTEHVALLVVHHIVSDGWSMGVLVREIAALYEAFRTEQPSPLEELAVQYADFAEWQREWLTGDVLEQQLKYWKDQLAGADTSLEMPMDRPRPARQTFRGSELPVTLSPELTAALGELGRAQGATMFMTLLAAFQVLLYRYTNQEDVLVGTPIANRNRVEIEGLIGFFANTLVLRAELSGDPTFRQLLERVRAVALGAYAHQDLPFEKLVEELQPERSLSRNPLFQVLFDLQNAPAAELALRGLTLKAEEFPSSFTRFDLELHLREREGGLRGELIYSTDLFDETTMRRLLSHFETLLDAVVRRDERISRIALLSEDEARQIIYKWNQETANFPRDLCLHELFAQQVERTADNIAVEFEGVTVSYAELNQRANQLARYLRQRGVGPDVPVGIMMQRSIEMTIAVLGILKAGGAYLPLDPEYPQERLSFMLEDSGAQVLLTSAKTPSKFPHARVQEVIRLDADWDDIAAEQNEWLAGAQATPLNLAYIIYTSGSTGQPKGVGMTHRPLVNLIEWQLARSAGAGRPLRTLQFTSLSFDVSFQEIFSTWLSGATLVLVSEEVRRDSRELLRVLVQERIERLFQPFIALQYLAELAEQDGIVPQHLREVITAGEQLKITRPIRNLFTSLNGCRLDNQYGPTEAHVVSSFMLDGPTSEWPELPPIGRPVANVQLYVLDACMQPVPAGVPGELYLGGEALARGYIGHAKASAEKFVPQPFDTGDSHSRLYRTGDVARYLPDGNIVFMGRRDQQVKVRGYRIEVSEVETALRGCEQVSEAVVVAHEGARGEKRLVGYVAPGAEVTASELRSLLKEKLPEYMVPSAFVFVEKWPLTPSGKINRKALPAPEQGSDESEYVAPRTTTEEKLAGIWSRLLGVERVGIHDSFFTLGGHSLLATQLMSRVRESFGIELPLRSLFEEPAIEGFAQTVERELRAQGKATRNAAPLRPMLREGDLPLSFAQQRMWFIDKLGIGGTAYSLAGAIRLTGDLDVAALGQSINEVIRRHEVLRTTFKVVDGEPVQVISPFQPAALSVVDVGEMSEAEREVKRLFTEEAQKPFDLAQGPLIRLSLLRTREREHVLIVNMHHIISDGWSMRVLVDEVSTLYAAFMNNAPSPLAELTVQYADYAQWQRQWLQEEVLDAQLNYWRKQLAGASPVLDLPTDRPRPAIQSWRGAKQPLAISAALNAQLQALAQREGVTLYMLLLAAFQTLLYRYTGQRDICVGSPVAGRHELETEGLIGLFINMLVMRARLDGDASFRQLLDQARTTALEAYAHQDVPFEKLVEELKSERDLSHAPLFQVMFVLHNAPRGAVRLPGLSLEFIESDSGTARYDLTLELSERSDRLEGWFEYNTDLFDASTVERMCEHLLTLLAALAVNPSLRLSELPVLTGEERRRMLVEWNNTATDYSTHTLVHQFFEEQAARTPGRTAVIFEDAELSYGELNRRANQLAHHLSAIGVKPGGRVGISIERSLDLMVGLLGILKAGAAYVPLDPSYPRERVAFMLADAEVTALLTQRRLPAQVAEQDARVVCIDADWPVIAQQQETNPANHLSPENLAYIIYTSGSTGKPKGVMVTHSNLANFLVGMDQRLLDEDSEPGTWLAVTSISFDISVLELFWTLARGWKVVLQSEAPTVGVALRGHPSVEINPGVATEGHPYNDSLNARPMEFSLFYFASSESHEASTADKYRLLIEGARFADEHDFTAVWTPERHFHAFGGLYPNPSVISAALAVITKKVALRAGSVVLPLHPSIRVAEEWAVVDNLSGGRVGVSFASGWHANDFVLEPESYAERQKVMYERIEEVRRLWRGEALTLRDGAGIETSITTLPRPVQEELPIWVTAAGSVETFRSAGKIGAGLLTHLLGQSVDELAEKIEAYRETWREAGHEGEGHVSLMLHTYVGAEMEEVRATVRGPFCDYLMQSVGLARNLTRSLGYDLEIESLSPDELKAILTRGFDRYFETSGLMGTPESCLRMINRLKAIGVDEVACLIDFGVAADDVMTSLKHLNDVRELSNPKHREAAEMDFSIPAQIARHNVTHLQCTPSMARMLLLDPRGAGALSSLKKLLVGGEELPAPLAAELAQVVTGEIHNMYGPTETTIWSTSHQVTQTQGAVPIGRPIANTEIYILDSHLQPVPAGVHGDLFIGGAGVVQGYLKRPELTSERFVPNPFTGRHGARLYRTGDAASYLPDGTIQFWGRTDNQVKLRGYRIELGEIEAVLTEHPAVREAAVVARTAESGEPSLVAYLVAASATEFPPRRMGAEAETLLGQRPRYTLPNGMTIAHHSSPQTSAIYREIFEDRVYARHGITFNDGDCIFDVGSNIGLFTLFANQMCKRPRIFAFEPIPPTFDILRTNVSLYDLDVKLFELGMADKVDVASFTFYREAAGLSGRTDYAAHDKQTTKTVITNWFSQVAAGQSFEADEQSRLDELMDEMMRGETFDCRLSTLSNVIRENGVERIDLLKIDVEGGELDVLNGIEEADWSKIKQVVLEVDTEDLLRQVSFKLETHGFHLAVDKTTTVREGAEYFYTVYATRTPQNGNSNGVPAAIAPALSTAELRSYLKERLPEYMVPSTFVTLDALPLTPNGKVNRQALPAPESGRRAAGVVYEAPRTKAEKLVSEIWREALRVEQVGVNDNFFDLGGNSLLLVKVHTRLQDAFSRKISMVEMFRRATVVSLAAYLTGEQNGKSALKQTQSRAEKQTAAINTQRELIKQRTQKLMKDRKR